MSEAVYAIKAANIGKNLNRFRNEMPQKLPKTFAKNNGLHLHVLVANVLEEIKCYICMRFFLLELQLLVSAIFRY